MISFLSDKKKRELRKDRHVLTAMVKRNVRSKYKSSTLGVIWTVLRPLLEMFVYWFIFRNLLARNDQIFHLYLLSGVIVFDIVSGATHASLKTIVNHQNMMRQTKLKYEIFPLANSISAIVNFAFSFAALLIIAIVTQIYLSVSGTVLATGMVISPTYFLTILWIPAVLLFSYGLSLLLSALYVFFRDIEHFYDIFLILWRFMTPIFYNITNFSDPFVKNIISFNPLTQYVTFFRTITIYGSMPDWTSYLAIYGWALIMLVAGQAVFQSTKSKFILYV